MKVAFVYDRVNKIGGAERVLVALHKIWPEAPLYTTVYDSSSAPWANIFEVRTSFFQKFSFFRRRHELLAFITPFLFSLFQFDDFDCVISITSADAKGIITKPHVCHICYCLTPTRYLWSGLNEYIREPGFGVLNSLIRNMLKISLRYLRYIDLYVSSRPDYYIAISQQVYDRIILYYKRKVTSTIYPPVLVSYFSKNKQKVSKKGDYYIVVSRLVSYKRIDLIIQACNHLKLPLLVIGRGSEEKKLRSIGGNTVKFITSYLTDDQLSDYYRNSRAFLFGGEEDFGIVGVEAASCGVPVICFSHSGMSEIVEDGKTGILFHQQTIEAVVDAIKKEQTSIFSRAYIQSHARKFDEKIFILRMQNEVKKILHTYQEQYCVKGDDSLSTFITADNRS